jgi:flagellar FliL protein
MPETNPIPMDSGMSAGQAPPAGAGKSIVGKLMVVLFLAAVVLAECLAAYLYLPSATETAAIAGIAADGQAPDESPPASEDREDDSLDQIEVDLEQFSVTAYQPVTNTTLRIDFHLFGTVAAQDELEFQTLMQKNVHRFREQVIVIVRGAELTDLTDAGLGLIKRRILEKTNRILGKPVLKAVIVSDFSFIEQ